MRIAFIVVGNEERGGIINGDKIRYGGVGSSGTDSSAILVAEYLAKSGHEVVFSVEGKTDLEVCRGVKYTNLQFDTVDNKEFDVLISTLWFHKYKELNIRVTKALIYWCHLAWMYANNEMVEYVKYNKLVMGVVHVSKWEKSHNDAIVQNMRNMIGMVDQVIIPNSIVTDVVKEIISENIVKIPKKTIFHAQWSRGGPTALDIVKRLGWDEKDFISFDYLKTVAGRADKRELFRQLAESEYFIFPSFTHGRLVYKDTFSCAVAEALALGVIVVAYTLGALPEYYNNHCQFVDFPDGCDLTKLKTEKVSEMPEMGNTDNMVEAIKLIEKTPKTKKRLSNSREYILSEFGIDNIGDLWNKYIFNLVSKKFTMNYSLNPKTNNCPFSQFDRNYYINLDSRLDRNSQALEEFSIYGVNVVRFPAVCMSIDESNVITKNGGAVWDIKVLTYLTQDMLERKLRAQRSCTKSHLEIIKKAKEDGLKNVLIFEDDVVFNRDIDVKAKLNLCLEELKDKEWDLFLLGCNPKMDFKYAGKHIAKLSGFYNAHAILVNSSAYDRILNFSFNTHMVIDQFHYAMTVAGHFNSYTPDIPLAFQRQSYSDIEERAYDTIAIQTEAYKHHLKS